MKLIRKEGKPPKDPLERVGNRCLNRNGPPFEDGTKAECRRWDGHDIPHRSFHSVNDIEFYYE